MNFLARLETLPAQVDEALERKEYE